MVGARFKGQTSPPVWTLAPLRTASGGAPPRSPAMASLSRTFRLQQLSCQLQEDLTFCSRRPRLSGLAVQPLFEQQLEQAPHAIDPALEMFLPW